MKFRDCNCPDEYIRWLNPHIEYNHHGLTDSRGLMPRNIITCYIENVFRPPIRQLSHKAQSVCTKCEKVRYLFMQFDYKERKILK